MEPSCSHVRSAVAIEPAASSGNTVRATIPTLAGRFAELTDGRRTKFPVIGVWVVVRFALGPLAGTFEGAQENDSADDFPADVDSLKILDRLNGFPLDDEADAITVFHRGGGLTAADRAAVERVRRPINVRVRTEINAERARTVVPAGPPGARRLWSALTTAAWRPERAPEARHRWPRPPAGVMISGPAYVDLAVCQPVARYSSRRERCCARRLGGPTFKAIDES